MPSQKKSLPAHLSRRSFLSSLGAAGVVATAGPVLATAQTATPVAPIPPLTLRRFKAQFLSASESTASNSTFRSTPALPFSIACAKQ